MLICFFQAQYYYELRYLVKKISYKNKTILFAIDSTLILIYLSSVFLLDLCYQISRYIMINVRGGVAQLVRASACHAEGREFKSRHSRHLFL